MRARGAVACMRQARSCSPSVVRIVTASKDTPNSRGVSVSPMKGKNAMRGSSQRTSRASVMPAAMTVIDTKISTRFTRWWCRKEKIRRLRERSGRLAEANGRLHRNPLNGAEAQARQADAAIGGCAIDPALDARLVRLIAVRAAVICGFRAHNISHE